MIFLSSRPRTSGRSAAIAAAALTLAGSLALTVGVTADAAEAPIVTTGYLLVDTDHLDPTPETPGDVSPEPLDQLPPATVDTGDGITPVPGKTRLAYTLVRPAGIDPATTDLPVLFEYSGYDPGTSPDSGYVADYVERTDGEPYIYLGVNLRGTACSEGSFDFFQPAEAWDAEQVIAWAADLDGGGLEGSNGRVAMVGKSYPGITQLFAAAQRPAGLVAISPGHYYSDVYRDVASPGGIPNKGFASLWSFIARPSYEFQTSGPAVARGNHGCARGQIAEVRDLPTNPMAQLLQHPWDDALYAERSISPRLADIAASGIAIWSVTSWQDEQLASRQSHLLGQLQDLGHDRLWAVISNGDHGTYRTDVLDAERTRFFDHLLHDADNGWETTAPIRIWWEATDRNAYVDPTTQPADWFTEERARHGFGGDPVRHGDRPALVTEHTTWSEATRLLTQTGPDALDVLRLTLGPDTDPADGPGHGAMTTGAPDTTGGLPSAYVATPGGSQGLGNARYGVPDLPDAYIWNLAPAPGTAMAFTSAAVDTATPLLGSASADLWLRTTNPDVDLQVTLTEVRPDGQEMFIQQGWLRASHRALQTDATPAGLRSPTSPTAASTALRPIHPHTLAAVEPVVAGEPFLARVEVFPFGHVLRPGSRLRLWVETPTVLPQLWSFLTLPTPAPVEILHDADHRSSLALPFAPGVAGIEGFDEFAATFPTCGTVIRQPCRPDPLG